MDEFSIAGKRLPLRALKKSYFRGVFTYALMSKFFAKSLQKDPVTVPKWCYNHPHPDLYTFVHIAKVLDTDIHKMIFHTKTE